MTKDNLDIYQLIYKINKYRDSYYNQSISLVSDQEYDELIDKLAIMEKQTGIYAKSSPIRKVGYAVPAGKKTFKHGHPLLSLDKTTSVYDFANYFDEDQDMVVMGKMDGLTVSITYKDGKIYSAGTRGDGVVGCDVLPHVMRIKNLPKEIPHEGTFVVDGECIIDYNAFNKMKSKEAKLSNCRNLASGALNGDDPAVCEKRNVKFIAWKLFKYEDSHGVNILPDRFESQIVLLKDYNFETVPYVHVAKGDRSEEKFEALFEEMKIECNSKAYPIDGLVGRYSDEAYCATLGRTTSYPKHSLAFKFYQEREFTKLIGVEWSTSRNGIITPVANFQTVEIDGTKVNRASLHNVSIFKKLMLGEDDTIMVIKANQIIPQVVGNMTKSNTERIPDKCPACGAGTYLYNTGNCEVLKCCNDKCSAALYESLAHFCGKNAMNIDGLSIKRVTELYENGVISSFIDILRLREKEHEVIRVLKNKTTQRILNGVEVAKNTTLERVLYAISIPSIGKGASKLIADYVYKIAKEGEAIKTFTEMALKDFNWSKIKTIGVGMEENINEYVKNNIGMMRELENTLVIEHVASSNTTLEGMTFCITGSLRRFKKRSDLQDMIVQMGGEIANTVAKGVILISNDKNSRSSKNVKARKLRLKVINEEEFLAMVSHDELILRYVK